MQNGVQLVMSFARHSFFKGCLKNKEENQTSRIPSLS